MMYTNKQGEKLWEIGYGQYDIHDRIHNITPINDNLFFINGTRGNSSGDVNNLEDIWGQTFTFYIDTLGNIINESESDTIYVTEYIQPYFRHPIPTADNNWMTLGHSTHVVLNEWDEQTLRFRNAIIKRDEDLNVLWRTSFGSPTSPYNRLIDLAPTLDGGWVAAGQYLKPEHYLGGMLAKVSADGDSLWNRVDVGIEGSIYATENYLSAVGVLSSGSIVAVGHFNDYTPQEEKTYAWLIKVDKHGCIEPGCNPPLATNNATQILDNFTLFPNPTSDLITIKGDGLFHYSLYNTQGLILEENALQYNETSIDVSLLPKGIYFLKIQQGNNFLTRKVVIE